VLKIVATYAKDTSWTIDIWTGLGQNEFAGYTAHFIDEDWVFRRVALDLDYFPQAHTGENISEKIQQLANKVGASPFQIVADSGANVQLGSRMHLGKDGTPLSARFLLAIHLSMHLGLFCMAHALDNLVKKACKNSEMGALIEKQTGAVKFVRKSNTANRTLRERQVELHAVNPNPFDQYHASLGWNAYPRNPLRLVIAGKTRWWSTKKQNKRFLRLKPALIPTLEAQLERDDIKPHKRRFFDFSASDWKVMEHLDDILDPFKDAIKTLEGEKYPTLSMVTMYAFSLQRFVQNRVDVLNGNSDWHSRVRSFLRVLKSGIDELCNSLPEEALIASLLDPRYLDTFIPVPLRQRYWDRLAELIEAERDAEEAQLPDVPPPPAPPAAGVAPPQQARAGAGTRAYPNPPPQKLSIDQIMAQSFTTKGTAQATETPYRNLAPMKGVRPLDWWKVKEAIYKFEARLARRYLAIPASSAPCERLFSTGGRVLEKRRASLKPETAKAIVLMHDNLHLLDELEIIDEAFYDDE
jgi:hypothetical protein